MRFQMRDGAILQAIYDYDGVLSRRHLKSMFWSTTSFQAMERRLSLLYHNRYLDWPSKEQRGTKPIPEPIVWLGWKGILWIAGCNGVDVMPPTKENETQFRSLDRKLRERGIRWLREPRWSQLQHDLMVVDFRLATENAISELPSLSLNEWITEGEFLSHTDIVEYTINDYDGKLKRMRKSVRPDGYFEVVDEFRYIQGTPARARFLLELDHATYDNARFGREKALPGIAYIRSPAYKDRFGYNSGRWLVVTTGRVRMKNLIRQTHQVLGKAAKVFFFTTFDLIETNNILIDHIWWQVDGVDPISLFSTSALQRAILVD
jgi:hypothetical protein